MMFNELSEKFAVSISSTPPKVESIGEIEDEGNYNCVVNLKFIVHSKTFSS